jgi:hypothetical protein
MALVILIPVAWLLLAAFVLALCRAGARGDEHHTQRPFQATSGAPRRWDRHRAQGD